MICRSVLVLFVAPFLVLASSELVQNKVFFNTHRLPIHVVPLHYDLSLNFDSTERFTGSVTISVKVLPTFTKPVARSSRASGCKNWLSCFRRPSTYSDDEFGRHEEEVVDPNWPHKANQIVLHADSSVVIDSIEYLGHTSSRNPKKLKMSGVQHDKLNQLLAINFDKPLKPESHGKLTLRFRSRMRDDLRGVYARNYNYGNGKEVRFIASQFQPTDARTVFPCFDEPNFKATFQLSISHSSNDLALSNTPELDRFQDENDKHLTTTQFETTPTMPVHMVAFMIGQFEYVERLNVGEKQTPVRVYTPPGLRHKAEFALEVASKSLVWMENYTSIAYPLKKFDLVTIFDHDKDNYESWGLTFVRANLSLFDDETKPDFKITIGVNVAHMLAHQWFANLITCRWWHSLWITEGVAAQKAFEIVLDLYPEYQSEYFVRLATLSGVIQMDSHVVEGLHALAPDSNQLTSSFKVYSIFDNLTFMKGGSIMQLLQREIGQERFREVLRILLERSAYGNVDEQDFADALMMGAQKSQHYLAQFSAQLYGRSYPVINLHQDGSSLHMNLTKPRVRELGLTAQFGDASGEHSPEVLPVPIESCPEIGYQLLKKPEWFELNNDQHWFKLNPQPDISTYFRVNYSSALIESTLKNALERKYLTPLDRLNVLDDAVGLVMAGDLSVDTLRQLFDHYQNEDHGGVILEMLIASKVLSSLKASNAKPSPASKVFLNLYERYGFEAPSNQSFVDSRAQMSTLDALVTLGNPDVIENALEKFNSSQGTIKELHLRKPVYSAVVSHGSEQQVGQLVAHLKETSSLEEQLRLVSALTQTRSVEVLAEVCIWLKSSRLTLETKQELFASIWASETGSKSRAILESRMAST